MRIAIVGAQGVGKNFLIESFLGKWKMYSTPEKTYRDILPDLLINEDGDEESQQKILDALCDQAIDNSGEKYSIHNRCVLDNLAYTMWLNENGKVSDNFVKKSIVITRETLKLYDIIFYLPIKNDGAILTSDNNEYRSTDEVYRYEIDNILYGMMESWKNSSNVMFDPDDSPAMIEIYGDEMNGEKTDMISQYINDDGDLFEDEGSVFQELENIMDEKAMWDYATKS